MGDAFYRADGSGLKRPFIFAFRQNDVLQIRSGALFEVFKYIHSFLPASDFSN